VIALGVVIALLIIVAGGVAVAAGILSQQNAVRASGTATALAQAAPTPELTSALTPVTPTPSSFVGTVKINDAELRQSSSDSSLLITLLPQGTRLTVRARTADSLWLKVEAADGTAGWILAKAIDLGGTSLDAIPLSVVRVTATSTPNLTATAEACRPAAQVSDVTVPDNSPFKPGETFVKTWRFLSAGNCAWGQGAALKFQSGDKLGGPDSIPVDAVDVGKSVDVSVTLTAPQSPGTYSGRWALEQSSSQVITTTDVSIVVPAPTPTRGPTSTPRPTAPPVATATATPGQGGAIGPVGSGPLEAAWTGSFWSCVATQKTDTDGNGYWVWEADFPIEVHGGNAGYTISSPACRWDLAGQKYLCRWGSREDGAVSQAVTVSCPGCKSVVVAVQAAASRKGTTCVPR
jgi:hypothetical protein